MSDWTAVAPAAEIEPGGYRSVDLDGTAVAVFDEPERFGLFAGLVLEDLQVVQTVVLLGQPLENLIKFENAQGMGIHGRFL